MSQLPSAELTRLLEQLGLATAERLRQLSGRVVRQARGMPVVDCLWIDALVSDRWLTPFQAAELIAGRGARLAVGPYVLCDPRTHLGYARAYAARRIDDGRPAWVHIVPLCPDRPPQLERQLSALVEQSAELKGPSILPVSDAGVTSERLWAACPWVESRTAADWMIHNGRFPPRVVLEIARQMATGLAALEKHGLLHGDISTRQLLIARRGNVWLPCPGLRGIARPTEGHLSADVPPEAFDYLAPERITHAAPPTAASDIYACGCVWWQMLTGRAPLAGGSSAAKLRALEAGRVESLDRYVRDVPEVLADAIAACTVHDPQRRPESMSRLAALLGPPEGGRRRLFSGRGVSSDRRPNRAATIRRPAMSRGARVAVAATAGCLVCLPLLWWAISGGYSRLSRRDEKLPAIPAATVEEPSPFYDANVARAAYDAPPIEQREAGDDSDALELPAGTWQLAALPLTRGQTVRGRDGQRPRVQVAGAGLRVDVDDVRFEHIDFVWQQHVSADGSPPAMIQLFAASVSFRGCTFQATSPGGHSPAAVRVFGDFAGADSLDTLPTARIGWTDCVFSGVSSGVELAAPLALVLTAENSLFLGPGVVVRLTGAPRSDEPVSINLRQFTVRDAGGVLACAYQAVDSAPGEMILEATGCVFALSENGALVTLSGPQKPTHLLAHLHWSGHGSLLSTAGALALWRDASGQAHTADEQMIDVDGLVRGDVEFAGAADAGVAASRIARWSAPLRSTAPPGIGPFERSRQRAEGRGQ